MTINCSFDNGTLKLDNGTQYVDVTMEIEDTEDDQCVDELYTITTKTGITRVKRGYERMSKFVSGYLGVSSDLIMQVSQSLR